MSDTEAYVLIHSNLGMENDVLEALQKLPEVLEAFITMGSYDLLARVKVPSNAELKPLVTNKIRILNGVRQTMTVIVV